MKILQLSLSTLAGIVSILLASSYVGFATAESTSILDSSIPPIILTQVELWGPSSFHTDGIKACEDNETSLGPWAVGWVEIHNTQNDSITINDVDLKGKGWEEGQFPMTLGPQEYCYIVTQNQLSTRIGVGGSLGNGPPPHDDATTMLSYSIQSFDKKMNYTDSTPPLSDDIGDTKTWQLVDGNWVFRDANFKRGLSTKITMLSPLQQFKSGISALGVKCNQGLRLILKSEDGFPACVKSDTSQKLIERGWAWNYANVVGKESISLSAYQGFSNESFYNNGTVVSNFTIDVNIHNFKPSNTSLVLQVYYDDGILYKTISVPSDMIQPDGFYKYQLIGVSDENHPVPFKVVATYNKETAITYAPVFAHP